MTGDLLTILMKLELTLQGKEVRGDVKLLSSLLHDDFLEFGRSGRIYTKSDIVKQFAEEPWPESGRSKDFALKRLSPDVTLLTYRTARLNNQDKLVRHTLRSSIWKHTDSGWQMIFHQGTATDPLPKDNG